MAYRIVDEKFWQKGRGYPAGYMLFADRRMTLQRHVGRQDNYHPLRQLMLNIRTLDRMIAHGAAPLRPTADAAVPEIVPVLVHLGATQRERHA